MSGVELCWETRLVATSRRPIYVVMMSSQYDQRSLIEALDSGADDFIGKPPLAEELYARLRAAERLASMQRELIRLATIDPLTGLCNRRGFFEQASEACARAARARREPLGHHPRHRQFQADQRFLRPRDRRRGDLRLRPRGIPERGRGRDGWAATSSRCSCRTARCRKLFQIAEGVRTRLAEQPFDTGKRPHHADLEPRRRRGQSRRYRRSDPRPCRCRALRREAPRAVTAWSASMPACSMRNADRSPSNGPRLRDVTARTPAAFRAVFFFFFFSFSRGMISMNEQGRWRLSSCALRMPFHASSQAPGDPGTEKI